MIHITIQESTYEFKTLHEAMQYLKYAYLFFSGNQEASIRFRCDDTSDLLAMHEYRAMLNFYSTKP